MSSKTIKISEENYKRLLNIAAELQRQREEKVTFDDALKSMETTKRKKKKLSDLAGSWKMSDGEWAEIKESIKRGWSKWKVQSA